MRSRIAIVCIAVTTVVVAACGGPKESRVEAVVPQDAPQVAVAPQGAPAAAAPAAPQGAPAAAAPAAQAAGDIVAVASSNPEFTTLVSALQAAGLVDTLQGPGPFTVFAPTNAAFAKIPKATLDAILADKATLTKILTYHVLPAKVTASQISNGQQATTVEGQPITLTVSGSTVKVNDATVVQADVAASNGVIHVIDTVLLPPDAALPATL
jgi:uncharacterized surface protein with fasciclin (FAS1) repeats